MAEQVSASEALRLIHALEDATLRRHVDPSRRNGVERDQAVYELLVALDVDQPAAWAPQRLVDEASP